MGIVESIIGNVVAGVILTLFGIGSVTIIVRSGGSSYNPRKKWKILMVLAGFALVITGCLTTTYANGIAHTSSPGGALMWFFGTMFIVGLLGNWVNK